MTDTKMIRFTGPFTDADIAEFVALLRRIDDANPTNVYTAVVDDPAKTLDEAKRLLEQMLLPPRPRRATTFAQVPFRERD